MSSGNPFRALALSSPVPLITETHRPEVGTQDDDVPAQPVSRPPRTKKHVRIESTAISILPQPDLSSPDDSPRTYSAAQYAGSSPPAPSAGYSNTSPGVYARPPGRSHDMAAPHNTASTTAASALNYPALSPSVVPANPFAKTLASMEPQRAGAEDREGAAQGNHRASLDVESFKNMLLTGRPYPRQAVQSPQFSPSQYSPSQYSTSQYSTSQHPQYSPSQPSPSQHPHPSPSQPPPAPSAAAAAMIESGSSTDASSVSRQSLLEPAQEAPAESPRTSHEMARSDEDSVAGLTPERTRSKRKPPPAPAHRHGKLVSPRQPQTVSFDSFAASEAAPSPVTRPRNTSDSNKPLPPAPIPSQPPLSVEIPGLPRDATSPPTASLDEPLSRSNSRQKRVPPPVPLARRQSQLRHSSADNRSRSSSSLTLSSQHSVEAPAPGVTPTPGEIASSATTTASLKSPPPPPPSRHGARLSDIGSTSANSSTTELPQRSTSVQMKGSSRRSTLEGELDLPVARTSSKRNSRIASSEGTNTAMPPPPPPPRRRPGSSRSSLDQQRPHIPLTSPTESRRTSTDLRHTSTDLRRASTDLRRTSLDNNRRVSSASEHSLRHDYTPAEEKPGNEYALYSPREEAEDSLATVGAAEPRKDSNNILEDMERFQREIDELRNKYKQAG